MENTIINRTLNEAKTVMEGNYTVREVAKMFNVSKSTVHKDLQQRLKLINKDFHTAVSNIFADHIMTRHIRGGESTRKKYLKLK